MVVHWPCTYSTCNKDCTDGACTDCLSLCTAALLTSWLAAWNQREQWKSKLRHVGRPIAAARDMELRVKATWEAAVCGVGKVNHPERVSEWECSDQVAQIFALGLRSGPGMLEARFRLWLWAFKQTCDRQVNIVGVRQRWARRWCRFLPKKCWQTKDTKEGTNGSEGALFDLANKSVCPKCTLALSYPAYVVLCAWLPVVHTQSLHFIFKSAHAGLGHVSFLGERRHSFLQPIATQL